MNTLLIVLLFILGVAIVYLMLAHKLNKLVASYFDTQYRNQIQSDIRAFYQEMENYAVLFEGKIKQFKLMLEESNSKKNSLNTEDIQQNINKNFFNKSKISNKNKKTIPDIIPDIIQEEKSQPLHEKHPLEKKPFPEIPKESLQEKEDSFAEQALLSSTQTLYTSSRKKEEPVSTPQENHHLEGFSNKVFSFLQNLGRSILGNNSFASNVSSDDHPTDVKPLEKKSFNELIENKIPKDSFIKNNTEIDAHHHSKKISSEPTNISSNIIQPIPTQNIEKDLDITMLLNYTEDLKKSKTRPKALKTLLEHGFTLENIAEMSEIEISLLQATKSMYQL